MVRRSWSINGRFLTQPITGVQRYAREIVNSLDGLVATGHELANGLDLELIVPRGTDSLLQLQSIRLREVGTLKGHLWEQIVLPASVRHGLLSLCNTGPLALRNHIVCIHDASTRSFPSSYSFHFRQLYRWLQPALGRTAFAVATVSRFSAAELASRGIAKAGKMSIAPNGHEHALRWRAEHTPVTRTAAGPYTIVVLGSPAPHKNIGLVIDLAPRLAAAGLKIAVVGLRDSRVFSLPDKVAEPTENILWLGRLTDNALAALLRDSLCLAFPSFAEGFGLPALEAMALGCPVVASDRTALPEICGPAALYAPPDAPEQWLESFLRLKNDRSLRAKLAGDGRANVQQYSWTSSALTYLNIMARADAVSLTR